MEITPAPAQTRVLALSNVAVSHTGNTNETALATVSVPAGAMGLSGVLRVTTVWSWTNSANAKTPRVRFGGIGGTSYLSGNATTTAVGRMQVQIGNRNSASSQIGGVSAISATMSVTTTALPTSTVDTTAAVDLVITGTLANGTETIALESYIVELIVP